MIKGFWKWFRSPSKTAVGTLLIVGGIGGIIFWGGFNTFMEYTNTLEFCVGCHEMSTVNEEYSHSIHYENNSGVRAVCSDCHVPKPWGAKLVRKIQASNEIFHKLMGSIDTPEKFKAKRMVLAGNVWRSMKETNSRECRNCHAFETMTIGTQRNDARFWHPMAMDEGFTCIDCHKGIAHQLPDMEGLIAEAATSFQSKLDSDALASDTLYTTTAKMLLSEGAADASVVGQLMPGVAFQVLERQDQYLRIAFDGEEVLGDSSQLYTDRKSGVVGVSVHAELEYLDAESTDDSQTRLTWRRARLTGWIDKNALISSQDATWSYAKTLYENECSRCHAVFSPSSFTANEWSNSLHNMRRFTRLNSDEFGIVSSYLQQHGKSLVKY